MRIQIIPALILAILCVGSASAAMIAYYSFDTTNTDASGNGYTITNPSFGYTSNSSCVIAPCAAFGDNSSTLTPTTVNITQMNNLATYTINFWSTSAGAKLQTGHVFSKLNATNGTIGARAQYGLSTSTTLTYETGTNIFPPGISSYANKAMWTFISNSSGRFIYVNGTRVNYTITPGTAIGNGNFTFGANGLNNVDRLIGTIDEISMYNTTLDNSSITCLYNSGNGQGYLNSQICTGGNVTFNITGLTDQYNSSTILTFNASINGTFYSTTTGSINTNINVSAVNGTIPVIINATGYYTNSTVITTGRMNGLYNYTNYIQCPAGDTYMAQNYTITQTQQNWTLTVNEYSLYLNFSTNTTGTITWQLPNAAGNCCQYPAFNNTSGYNATNFRLIIATTAFADGDRISVRFNPQNSTNVSGADLAQYYEYISDATATTSDRIGVLTTIDRILWVNTYNYGNDQLFDAVVRFAVFPDQNQNTSYVVGQRITRPLTGDSAPGTPMYVNSGLTYWISTTKEGYTCETVTYTGIDFENNLPVNIRCTITTNDNKYNYQITGRGTYTNETTLYYTVSNPAGTALAYNTTNAPGLITLTTTNAGAGIALTNGTGYTTGQNITIQLWNYSTTSGYTYVASFTTIYQNPTIYSPINQLGSGKSDKTVATLLFIAIIIISSIVGAIIKKRDSGTDTGYYIFSGLCILGAIINTQLIAAAAISILTLIGTQIFSVSRD